MMILNCLPETVRERLQAPPRRGAGVTQRFAPVQRRTSDLALFPRGNTAGSEQAMAPCPFGTGAVLRLRLDRGAETRSFGVEQASTRPPRGRFVTSRWRFQAVTRRCLQRPIGRLAGAHNLSVAESRPPHIPRFFETASTLFNTAAQSAAATIRQDRRSRRAAGIAAVRRKSSD